MAEPFSSNWKKWLGIGLPVAALALVASFAGIVLSPETREPDPTPASTTESAPPPRPEEPPPDQARSTPERLPTSVTAPAPPSVIPAPRESLDSHEAKLELALEDPQRRPIADAEVEVTAKNFSTTATSNHLGQVTIETIPPGAFDVAITKRSALIAHHF